MTDHVCGQPHDGEDDITLTASRRSQSNMAPLKIHTGGTTTASDICGFLRCPLDHSHPVRDGRNSRVKALEDLSELLDGQLNV